MCVQGLEPNVRMAELNPKPEGACNCVEDFHSGRGYLRPDTIAWKYKKMNRRIF